MIMTNIRQLLEKLEILRKDEKYFIVRLVRTKNKLEKTQKTIRMLEERNKKLGE